MRHEMEVNLLPDAIKSVMGKSNTLSKKDQVRVLTEMASKVYEEMLKAGTSAVLPSARPDDSPDKLATAAAAAAAKDAQVKKLVLKETEAALKRLKLDQGAPGRRGAKD
ncbi:MAG: hypothetical protein KF887_15415 [Paracoccaceae bacterium]|nr:MAG: hypothetical protein KF887_15415 [Paracoccaceae bacterium]